MALLMPAALREHFALSLRLYEDGSVMLSVRVGPSDGVVEFETSWLASAPDGLQIASEVARGLVSVWADAGVLGLASEAPG